MDVLVESIATTSNVHTFARHMLMPFSVDKMLLLRYANFSTNFRGLLFKVEMVPSHLKHMNSVFVCIYMEAL